MTRPNILLISADQQRAECLGFMGRKVKTPHLDQMAGEGTHFTAYQRRQGRAEST